MGHYTTVFGSLDSYAKGGVEVINDDPEVRKFQRTAFCGGKRSA
jgi:hypothetical protein